MGLQIPLVAASLLGTYLTAKGQAGVAGAQAAATIAQAAENRRAAEFNAAELEALIPGIRRKRGADIRDLKRNLVKIVSTQTAQAGASGIATGSNSFKRLKTEAKRLATLDRIEIDIAADQEIGQKTRQAKELRRSGIMTSLNAVSAAKDIKKGGKLAAFGTALSGAVGAYSTYQLATT